MGKGFDFIENIATYKCNRRRSGMDFHNRFDHW